MDPLIRTSLIIFAAVLVKSVILAWWQRFKAKKAGEPIPMKLKNGVHVAWGPVQKVQHYGWRLTQLWMVYMVCIIAAVVWIRLIQPALG